MKFDSSELASLKPVGTAIDDGTQGRATIEFPATKGRYVMLRWIPAAHDDVAFTVAEITADGTSPGSKWTILSIISPISPHLRGRLPLIRRTFLSQRMLKMSRGKVPLACLPNFQKYRHLTFLPVVAPPAFPPVGPPTIDPHSL